MNPEETTDVREEIEPKQEDQYEEIESWASRNKVVVTVAIGVVLIIVVFGMIAIFKNMRSDMEEPKVSDKVQPSDSAEPELQDDGTYKVVTKQGTVYMTEEEMDNRLRSDKPKQTEVDEEFDQETKDPKKKELTEAEKEEIRQKYGRLNQRMQNEDNYVQPADQKKDLKPAKQNVQETNTASSNQITVDAKLDHESSDSKAHAQSTEINTGGPIIARMEHRKIDDSSGNQSQEHHRKHII